MKHLARPFTAPALIMLAALVLSLAAPCLAQPPGATPPSGRQAATAGIAPATQATPAGPAAQATPRDQAVPDLQEKTAVTRHTIRIGGQPVAYTATAGNLLLRDDRNKPIASFFYVYYTRDGVTDLARRPIFYSFNGGPGTASIWMHVGFTGPRRVIYDEEGFQLQPPYRLHDNEQSILDIADIVYIDPIGVGYSRMAPGEDPHRFHGMADDIAAMGDFIRVFTVRERPLEVAEVPDRRELRHDAGVRAGGLPAEPAPDVHERRRAGVDDQPRRTSAAAT